MSALVSIRLRLARVVWFAVAVALAVVSATVMLALLGYEALFRANLPAEIAREFDALEAAGLDNSVRGIEIFVRYRPPVDELFVMLGSLALGVVLAIALVYPITRAAVRAMGGQLDRIAAAARRLAAGDFTARTQPPKTVRDTLDRLTMDFNQMACALAAMEVGQRADSAAIAHELRTPVSALRVQLEALRDDMLTWTPELATQLLGQVLTLARLVEDLRTVTLARSGQLQLLPEDLELLPLVESIVTDWSLATKTPVQFESISNVPSRMPIDPTRLRQILVNLLENARRHGSPPIEARCFPDPAGSWRIEVRDHGPGLRGGAASGRSGDRLGLNIVHQLCHALRIEIDFADVPHGTCVVLRVPQLDSSHSCRPALSDG
jgi:signal transduction histidine kinase